MKEKRKGRKERERYRGAVNDSQPERLLSELGKEILQAENMKQERQLIQHGSISCYGHSVFVAYLSLRISRFFSVPVDMNSMARGALLHDYFLYDWHVPDRSHRFHGFYHAGVALKNAGRDFALNEVEQNIIEAHMFPLNLTKLPRYRESVIVNVADKICAICEILAGKRTASFIGRLEEKMEQKGQRTENFP